MLSVNITGIDISSKTALSNIPKSSSNNEIRKLSDKVIRRLSLIEPGENIWQAEEAGRIPDDLKILEMMLACWILPDSMKEEFHIGISSYKLWDEQIVFGAKSSANTQSAEDMYFSFSYMVDKYKNFNLAI